MVADSFLSHLEECFGDVHLIVHEISPPQLNHIDVLIFKATEERPFHVLVTSGMSNLPMNTPKNIDVPSYVELMMVLPSFWQIPKKGEVIGDQHWPVQLLRYLAHFPDVYQTWLGFGHTIPNDDPPIPFANDTLLCGSIILSSCYMPEEFQTLSLGGKTIQFFSVVPLYQEEMELKVKQGSDELLSLFDQNNINDLVIPDRMNVALS